MSNKTDTPHKTSGGTAGDSASTGNGGGGKGGGGGGGSPQTPAPPSPGPQSGSEGGGDNNKNSEPPPAEVDPSRACCFCWCCCCSCSCLTVKNNEETSRSNEKQSLENLNGEDSPPSVEEVRTWGESFDKLMKSAAGRKSFREFLKCEYSEENMLFWLACEDLKKESSQTAVADKARLIYEDYISILSPKEVSLDSRVRETINRNMVEPSPHTFDDAQLQIYTLMHRDSYPRFVNSPIYRKLAQLNSTSRKESTA